MTILPLTGSHPSNYLFDRLRPAHPWFAALGELENSLKPGHAPLAQNWRMDDRVDDARENHLNATGYFPAGSLGSGFKSAIREYYNHYQCRSPAGAPCAAYAESTNESNRIPFDERPARNNRLLHLVAVKSLLRHVMNPTVSGKADFEIAVFRLVGFRLPENPANSDVERLVNALNARGQPMVKEFARALSEALGVNEPHWWASFAHEIDDMSATSDWTNAVRITGQGEIEQGEWLMAWNYSPEVAGKLFRPTVAEAGTYAFHFPSPPTENYGITMPLASSLPAVRELIHAPLKGDTSADACIGFGKVNEIPAPVRTPNDIGLWFRIRRHEHGKSLVRSRPRNILTQSWLERHSILP